MLLILNFQGINEEASSLVSWNYTYTASVAGGIHQNHKQIHACHFTF